MHTCQFALSIKFVNDRRNFLTFIILQLFVLNSTLHVFQFLPPATKVGARLYFHRRVRFCSQGGSASVHAGIPPPWDQAPPPSPGARHPPGTMHPQDQAPPGTRHPPGPGTPPEQSILGDTVNERAVCILLECNSCFFNDDHQQGPGYLGPCPGGGKG